MPTTTVLRRTTARTYLALALPPLVLAAVGSTHPMYLTAANAEYWRNLHIAILPIFPLLGFAPWLVVRQLGHHRALAWVLGILGFVYAAFYSALDVLAGIGAGGLKLDGMGMATGVMYGLARPLGFIGSIALLAACAIAAVVSAVRAGIAAIPGGVLVIVGALLFLDDHIYFPIGVIGQLCLAVGWLALVIALRGRADDAATAGDAAARS